MAINNARKWFFNFFFNFLAIFFFNFLPQVGYERNSGLKFFSFFLGLAQSVLIRNNAGINFFNFLNFFAIFFGNFLAPVEKEQNSGLKFFSSCSAYLILFWLKIMPEKAFLIFCNFFRNFFPRAENERNMGLNFLFSVFLPTSSSFGNK